MVSKVHKQRLSENNTPRQFSSANFRLPKIRCHSADPKAFCGCASANGQIRSSDISACGSKITPESGGCHRELYSVTPAALRRIILYEKITPYLPNALSNDNVKWYP